MKGRFGRLGKLTLSVAISAMAIGSASSASLACGLGAMDSGVVSKAVKTLQSDLMVAALSCGGHESYNDFMVTYNPFLIDQNNNLKQYFLIKHGGKHKKELNTYITSVANQGALRMAMTGKRFCVRSEVLHDSLSEAPSKERLRVVAIAYAASAIPELADELDAFSTQQGCTAYKVAFDSDVREIVTE